MKGRDGETRRRNGEQEAKGRTRKAKGGRGVFRSRERKDVGFAEEMRSGPKVSL